LVMYFVFFFSSRRRHTRSKRDWSSDVCSSDLSQNCQDAVKLINARIGNLETNLHIEIDMERIEDRSKALSYIGIEVADALKLIRSEERRVGKECRYRR